MYAAIKILDDMLLLRRLQARELSHDDNAAERAAVLNRDIASLERGLRLLIEASAPPSAHGLRPTVNGLPQNAPQKAIPAQKQPEAT